MPESYIYSWVFLEADVDEAKRSHDPAVKIPSCYNAVKLSRDFREQRSRQT